MTEDAGLFMLPDKMTYSKQDQLFEQALLDEITKVVNDCDACDIGIAHRHGCFIVGGHE